MLELYACWIWLPSFLAASAIAQGHTAEASVSWVNALSFIVLAAGAIGCVIGGELADRIGPVRLVVISMFVSGSSALLTPHISPVSPGRFWPRALDVFCDNWRRYDRGEPLRNLVDKQAGY